MPANLTQYVAHIAAISELLYQFSGPVLMLVLLTASAFFSAAETAFFNISHRQRKQFEESDHGLQHLAARLINKPSRLLSCLSFGNMLVNVLYFATASVLTARVAHRYGVTAGTITAVASFVVLILFGEILPKSLAYTNSRSVSIFAALPIYII